MKKFAKAPEDEVRYVEQLQFEYTAEMNVLAFLTKQEGVKEEYLERYFSRAKEKNIMLEIAKEQIVKKYKPKEIEDISDYNFVIDFDSCFITYESKD